MARSLHTYDAQRADSRIEGTAVPCPACKKAVNAFEAAGIAIDAYDFGRTACGYTCPKCGAALEQVVPLFSIGPLWYWRLQDEWLQRQLEATRSVNTRKLT